MLCNQLWLGLVDPFTDLLEAEVALISELQAL
jgi:hypothetical protein